MKLIRNIFTIGLVTFVLSGVFSFTNLPDEKNKPGDDKKNKTKREDTTAYAINENALTEDSDSLDVTFPSNDLYADWDTTKIHNNTFSDYFKDESKNDSIVIDLSEALNGLFTMPYKGNITSHFGWRRYRAHYGTDIDLETGDSVSTAFDGMVRIAKSKVSGYGNVVVVRHNNGLETVYAHLSKILVEPGQQIKAGELIGLGGNTGRSTGSHLHFEIRFLGQPIDSEDLIDFVNGKLKQNEFVLKKSEVELKYDLRALHSRHKHDVGLSRSYTKNNNLNSKLYKIKPGDTLGKIAQKNKTTIKAICEKNKFKQTKVLQIGQIIKI